MILYELRCCNEHHFEAWFRDGAAYDAQAHAGEVECPVCGDRKVSKAIMAPRLNKATGQALDAADGLRQMRKALTDLRGAVESNCDYVGDQFADEARKIHYGETEARAIYGEASDDQARALEDEGVSFQRVPWINREN